MALGRLGERTLATDAVLDTGNDKEARYCRLYFDVSKESVLRSHLWNFAEARVELVADSANPLFGYAYRYLLPNDCVRVFSLNQSDPELEPEFFWKVAGRYLYTDETTCKIVYTENVDISLFDALAVKSAYLELASNLAYSMLADENRGKSLHEEFESLVSGLAKSIDSQEGNHKRPSRFKHSRWWKARYSRRV